MGSRTPFSLGSRFFVVLLLFILSFSSTSYQSVLTSTEVLYGPVVYERGTTQPTTIEMNMVASGMVTIRRIGRGTMLRHSMMGKDATDAVRKLTASYAGFHA